MANPNTAKFPTTVATDTDLLVASDRATATLAGAIGSTDLTILTSTQGFIAPCVVSVNDELILISVAASTVLTVATGGRGYDGTTPASHAQGQTVAVNIIRWHHNQLAAEVKAVETFLGTNGTNIGQSGVYSQLFNWSQTPGGSLGVGSNVVTLVPVPPGISGGAANTYVYLSGGTGAAEACLITGGTAVAGNPSGTIIFSCANTHTGGWTIATATSGIKEALNTIPADGGRVWLPAGKLNIYATIVLGAGTPTTKSEVNSMSLIGQGAGRGADTAFPADGATTLLWGGASGGTMMKVLGPVGDGTVSDMMFDGQGVAAIGLDIVHSYSFLYKKLTIVGWSSIGVRAVAVDYSFSGMAQGCNNNFFDTVLSGAGTGGGGSIGGQFGQGAPNVNSIFDFASNIFVNSSFRSDAGTGMELRFADNNVFQMTSMVGPVALHLNSPVAGFPGANVFYQCPMGLITSSAGFDLTSTNVNLFFPLSNTDVAQDVLTLVRFGAGFDFVGKWFGVQRDIPLYYATATVSTAISNTVSETAFSKTYTILKYVLNVLGTQVRVKAAGRISSAGSPTMTFRVKIGGVTIGTFTFAVGSGVTGDAFTIESSFTVAAIGTGAMLVGPSIGVMGGFSGASTVQASRTVGFQGCTFTVDNILSLTGQWSVASTSNIVTLDSFTLDILYPGTVG